MSTNNDSGFPEREQCELAFPGNEKLEKAVAGGTYYKVGDLAFVVFLLDEEHGYTLCWARGDSKDDPMGESFERAQTFPTLEEAQAALAKAESVTLDFFNTLSEEMVAKQ